MFIFVDKIAFTVSPRVNQLQNSQMDSEIVVVPRRRWQQISTQRMYYLSLVDDNRDAGRMCSLLRTFTWCVVLPRWTSSTCVRVQQWHINQLESSKTTHTHPRTFTARAVLGFREEVQHDRRTPALGVATPIRASRLPRRQLGELPRRSRWQWLNRPGAILSTE